MTAPSNAQFPPLVMVGLNHRTAPVAVREAVAFNHNQTIAALKYLRQQRPRTEAVILSTCNRVELYAADPSLPQSGCPANTAQPAVDPQLLVEFLAGFHQLSGQYLQGHTYDHRGPGVVEHLFSVAGSLDSMVLGETQILAQVKQAYQWAMEAGSAGPVLHALFQRAFAAAKDVHEQTELSGGRISIASVAVDLLHDVFDRFDDKTVLVVGAGKMAELMLRQIRTVGPKRMIITNRSIENGRTLAEKYGLQMEPFENLDDLLVQADVVLTGTGSREPIITAAQMKRLMRQRHYRPLVMVDIAVPRDIDQAVGRVQNIFLYNIDDLEMTAQANRDRRGDQVDRCRALIGRHVMEFGQWSGSRSAGPVVRALYDHVRSMGQREVEEMLAGQPGLTESQRDAVRKMTHRLIGKILHAPVSQLTGQSHDAGGHETMHLARAIVQLFQLPPEQAADSIETRAGVTPTDLPERSVAPVAEKNPV